MRVKTPWIEALTKSREDAHSSQTPRAQGKPDLTPKKMSDSYYSAVSPTLYVVCFAWMRIE
jgi:acyl-coenzyme A thioesterase 9